MAASVAEKTYNFAPKKYNTRGRPIPIYANYFPINIRCKTVYRYGIDIQQSDFVPNKEDKKVPQRNKMAQQKRILKENNFAIFERLVKQEASLFDSEPVFDGKSTLYSKTRLRMSERTYSCKVKFKVPENRFPLTFDVIIIVDTKDSNELDLSVLKEKNAKNVERELQALNIILQFGFRKYKLSQGNNIFMKHDDFLKLSREQKGTTRFNLTALKEASFGHFQAAKMTEIGVALNVDRVAIVFNKGGKLLDLVENFCSEMRSGPSRFNGPPPRKIEIDENFKLFPRERKDLEKNLKDLFFEADHIPYKPRFKIFGITEKSISEIFFDQRLEDDRSEKVSVLTYFESKYKDYIDKIGRRFNPNLPCVQVGKMQARYFPMEVVNIAYDQYDKKSDPKIQKIITRKFGDVFASERFKETQNQVKNLLEVKTGQIDYLKYFDIEIKPEFIQCEGRIFGSPSVQYGLEKKVETKEGQWTMRQGNEPLKYVKVSGNVNSDWAIINFTKVYTTRIEYAPNEQKVGSFINLIIEQSKKTGNIFGEPCKKVFKETYKGRRDLVDNLFDLHKLNRNLRLVIYIIPRNNDEIYHSVKYASEVGLKEKNIRGPITQCISQEKDRQFSQRSYVENLMLKINPKLCGTNIHLDPNSKVGFLKKITMIVGIDCTHPSRTDRLGNSIVGVVSTYDREMINYYSKCVVQPKTSNSIVELKEIIKKMIEVFETSTKRRPANILVYREGVSDGQFKDVMDKEVKSIKMAASEISSNYEPFVTFIVVQKRHHSRFLPKNEHNRTRKSQNVLPGTVIDTTIVSNFYNEFYLTSHFGPLGTSRPTRYIVLHDDTNFTGEEIQETTNLLTYLFPRCTKAVSVPSPVLYAGLACKRARSYLLTLDNNKGKLFGEEECTPKEIKYLNEKIEVSEHFQKFLYYI